MTENRNHLRAAITKREYLPIADELGLSEQEGRVAWGLLNGQSEGEIAKELGIAPNTVHTHVKRVYGKTNTHGQVDLANRFFDEFRSQTEPGYRRRNRR